MLRRGPSPLKYLKDSIRKYISCVQNALSHPDCDEILRAPAKQDSMLSKQNVEQEVPHYHHSFKVF